MNQRDIVYKAVREVLGRRNLRGIAFDLLETYPDLMRKVQNIVYEELTRSLESVPTDLRRYVWGVVNNMLRKDDRYWP